MQVATLQATAPAQQLSTDVWAKIFAYLKPQKDSTVHSYEDIHEQVGVPWAQTEQILRSVCKRFDEVFKQHPQLYSNLWLSRFVHARALPGLLAYIGFHSAAISQVALACNTPFKEAVLAALVCHKAPMTTVLLNRVDGRGVELIAAVPSITTCVLSASTHEVSLGPLKSLPNLQQLQLGAYGNDHISRFTDVDAAAVRLTQLSLTMCHATCAHGCECVTSLVALSVSFSNFERFHERGVSACSRLISLECRCSIIGAVDVAEVFETPDFDRSPASVHTLVPTSLSTLTALTSLSVFAYHPSLDHVLDWPTQLLRLRSFVVEDACCNLTVPPSFEALSNLTSVSFQACAEQSVATLQFQWTALVKLERLDITGTVETCGNLKQLTSLTALKDVNVALSRHSKLPTVLDVVQLAHCLGTARPDVMFSCQQCERF